MLQHHIYRLYCTWRCSIVSPGMPPVYHPHAGVVSYVTSYILGMPPSISAASWMKLQCGRQVLLPAGSCVSCTCWCSLAGRCTWLDHVHNISCTCWCSVIHLIALCTWKCSRHVHLDGPCVWSTWQITVYRSVLPGSRCVMQQTASTSLSKAENSVYEPGRYCE